MRPVDSRHALFRLFPRVQRRHALAHVRPGVRAHQHEPVREPLVRAEDHPVIDVRAVVGLGAERAAAGADAAGFELRMLKEQSAPWDGGAVAPRRVGRQPDEWIGDGLRQERLGGGDREAGFASGIAAARSSRFRGSAGCVRADRDTKPRRGSLPGTDVRSRSCIASIRD